MLRALLLRGNPRGSFEKVELRWTVVPIGIQVVGCSGFWFEVDKWCMGLLKEGTLRLA